MRNGIFRGLIAVIVAVVLAVGGLVTLTNGIMVSSVKNKIVCALTSNHTELSGEDIKNIKEAEIQCIIVPGASVYANGNPSPMLRNRLDTAVELYDKLGQMPILLSGDNGNYDYNEVRVMAKYIMGKGVDKDDVFCDFAGFSTYETAYRAVKIFDVKSAAVVTQSYHMYRALYGCDKMGMKVIGICADQRRYGGQFMRDIREVVARTKDTLKWKGMPEPTFLGDEIPITGKGNCPF